jgi:hypothetical protein
MMAMIGFICPIFRLALRPRDWIGYPLVLFTTNEHQENTYEEHSDFF